MSKAFKKGHASHSLSLYLDDAFGLFATSVGKEIMQFSTIPFTFLSLW